jgi:hypothetical protein
MIVQMQPKGINLFNEGLITSGVGTLNTNVGGTTVVPGNGNALTSGLSSKYVDKYPIMDEQCR